MRIKTILLIGVLSIVSACATVRPNATPVFEIPEDAEVIETADGLQVTMVEEGTGPKPQPGDTVVLHYAGSLENGTQFDASYNRTSPFSFVVGQGDVISGMDEGITLIGEGSKAVFTIPPELGYGDRGAGNGVIPPGETLTFEIELLEVIPAVRPAASGTARPATPPSGLAVSAYVPNVPRNVRPIETESGLQIYITKRGNGPRPTRNDTILTHYNGLLQATGETFDSSYRRGRPFEFVLGQGMVIPGWDEAFALLRVGSQAIIIIPPEMAYGENGAPPVIPPDATLVFEVALLEVFDGPDPIDLPDFTVPDDAEIIETRSGLLIVILEWGEGPLPQEGDTVSVLYVGTLEEDETEFDNAYLRGTPIEFPVGEGYVIPGWDEALLLMPEGTRAVLIIPPDLAYGEEGAPPVIPSDAVLRFGIDLVKVTPADDQ